jgi:hypothetical protein
MSEHDKKWIRSLADSGVASLKGVLSDGAASGAVRFAEVDARVRDFFFSLFTGRRSPGMAILRKAVGKVCFSLRKHMHPFFPGYVFPDGYIGRDIGIRLESFEYHMHDTCDLAKLILQLQELPGGIDPAVLEHWGCIVDRALDYTISSSYFRYVTSTLQDTGRAVSVCEAILARLGAIQHGFIPVRWSLAYCQIRRSISASPALLGYDPFVVKEAGGVHPTRDGWDTGTLWNGRRFAVNYLTDEFFLDAAAESAVAAW